MKCKTNVRTVEVTAEYLDALRKAVGLQINPETAEVAWTFANTFDPYGDDPNLPEGVPASRAGILRPFSWK